MRWGALILAAVLAAAGGAQGQERLSEGPTLLLRGVRFEGNTVFSNAELAAVAASFIGREVTSDDLQDLRYRLSEFYVSHGYISSGAILPDQDVVDGTVTYRIVEGAVTDIHIEGAGGLRPSYVADRLALGLGPPLHIENLRERIQLLLQDPLIGRLNAELAPGLAPGESRLDVAVTRNPPYDLALTLDNQATASVGEWRGRAEGVVRNLTGWGDTADFLLGRTGGLTEFQAGFAVPVTRWDTTLGLRGEWDDASVIEAPLSDLDIRSKTRSVQLYARHPVWRTPRTEVALEAGVERARSESFLLGRPFSFTPGTEDGRSDVTVLTFTQSAVHRGPDRVVAGRSSFRFGVDALGATAHGGLPDGQFVSWQGQAQWAQRLDERGAEVIARADVQWSNDALLPLERFAVGGADTVRGYRQNALVRDGGFILSVEERIPWFRLPLPGVSRQAEDGMVQLAPFIDYARAWNRGGDTSGPDAIAGIGIGLRWDPSPRLQARLYYGQALTALEDKGDSLQDRGIHLRVTFRPF